MLAFDIDMTSAKESSGPGGGSARRYQAPSPGSAVAEGREAEAWKLVTGLAGRTSPVTTGGKAGTHPRRAG